MSKKVRKIIFVSLCAAIAVPILLIVWLLWGGVSNPANRRCIGEISTPWGYERVEVKEGSFGDFIRQFPLQKRGSHMRYYDGRLALVQYWDYAVLDQPMLSDDEECADAVMRMRGEYLWWAGQFNSIHFTSVRGEVQRYRGGPNRDAFEKYMKNVFIHSNTSSLRKELKPKSFHDIAPGDVFVYASDYGYGHAVLVVDVARNARTGKTAIMLAQSSMPALTMHVLRNILHPVSSPWIILDEEAESFFVSGIRFKMTDLRTW